MRLIRKAQQKMGQAQWVHQEVTEKIIASRKTERKHFIGSIEFRSRTLK